MSAATACLCGGKAAAQTPEAPGEMPSQWQYTEGFAQQSPASDQWWRSFGDEMLDSLIAIGIENNYDVLNAAHRIEMARQSLRQVQSQYYPTIGLSAGWSAQRTSGMMTSPAGPAAKMQYYDLGADMSWQIDVFGKIRARADQGKAAFKATRAEYDAMMVTVTAKIASAYFQLRMLQAEKAVLDAHVGLQRRVADITQARHDAGLASQLDVAQALTTYYSTMASIASVNTSIDSTINGIAILLGLYPDQIRDRLGSPAPMPDYHQIVAVGIPMDLLRRRPDIAEAEYTLAGYAAALGVAKKDFLPTLSLNGHIGTSAHRIGDLMKDGSLTYSVAPTLSWTLFEGLSRKAAVASAKEQMQIGINNYNSALQGAVQEVENAMSAYSNALQYIDAINDVVERATESFNLSIDLYKQGLTAFINVTNSQISYLQYSNELVSAHGQALAALVNLYEALGGGWSRD